MTGQLFLVKEGNRLFDCKVYDEKRLGDDSTHDSYSVQSICLQAPLYCSKGEVVAANPIFSFSSFYVADSTGNYRGYGAVVYRSR